MAANQGSPITTTTRRELNIIRVFNAPRELVWRAWTDPARVMRWMGPRDYPAVSYEQDFREGGSWRGCLRGADGVDLWQGGIYKEISEPARLVFTFAWDGDDGQPDHQRGHQTVVTVNFIEKNGKTEMRFHQAVFNTAEQMTGHHGGWSSTFDRLEDYLTTG